jgi:hypothetical protein
MLRSTIQALPEEQRDTVALHYVRGLRIEIAILSSAPRTVSAVRIHEIPVDDPPERLSQYCPGDDADDYDMLNRRPLLKRKVVAAHMPWFIRLSAMA